MKKSRPIIKSIWVPNDKHLIGVCTDRKGFVREVNTELMRIWEESNGYDPSASARLEDVEGKITNIRRAIEDGLADTGWANERLSQLTVQLDRLPETVTVQSEPPKIDIDTALAYRHDIEKVLAQGTQAEKKQILRAWVDQIKLAPETLEVEIHYRIPGPVVDSMGAAEKAIANYPPLRIYAVEVKTAKRNSVRS